MSDRTSEAIPPIGALPEHQHPARPQHPLANYQFSSDELRVLRECNTESFFQRSLPIGTALGLAAYYGVKRGFLTPNVRYGAVPKVVVSVIIGYFLGKISYQRKCAEKMMQLPNSKLAEVLRQKKRGGNIYDSFTPDKSLGGGFGLSPFQSTTADLYSDEDMKTQQGSSLDLDLERPSQSGLDDIYRPSVDNPYAGVGAVNAESTEPNKPSVTYEELRKKNREEYAKRSQSTYTLPPPAAGPSSSPGNVTNPPVEESEEREMSKRKNRYGDVWS